MSLPSHRLSSLPIDSILPELHAALGRSRTVILSADPGAGKTTRVPLALLDAEWLSDKKMIMLEPRRLAAQRAAHYMASLLGEEIGRAVGYRIRGETEVSERTRIEVVTEGILTRMLQGDPTLPGVGLLIFDEFHERSIHADLGLAFSLDVQEHLRPDLRILVMSATLDRVSLAALLGDVPVVACQGRSFPVDTHYLSHTAGQPPDELLIGTILRSLQRHPGDVLAFLPGRREILRAESALLHSELPPDVSVHTLFGDASPRRQQAALKPAMPGKRKVILSTNIAETSLTIDGVRIVIDSGLVREPRFDPRRGMGGLVTVPVSQASADQRRGRAGRQQPGVCYRLWTMHQHEMLPRYSRPEILTADLAPLALELAHWGDPQATRLRFLDPPPGPHLSQARSLLKDLGALDASGSLTPHGRAMAELPVHPRLAHMMIKSVAMGLGGLACDVAALLEERDVLHGETDSDIDLASRWHVLRSHAGGDPAVRERMLLEAERLRSMLRVEIPKSADKLGVVLALAYPERVAKKHRRRFQLAGGQAASLPERSLLQREDYLAVGDVDGVGNQVRVFLAARVDEAELLTAFADDITTQEEVEWDNRKGCVLARRTVRLGALVLSESPLPASDERVRKAMLGAIRLLGLEVLPWSEEALRLRQRSEWIRGNGFGGPDWPDLSDHQLLEKLEEWLGPHLGGMTKKSDLSSLNLRAILMRFFRHAQLKRLDRLAPSHIVVPSGSRISVDYSGLSAILAVKLQEMFGLLESPRIGDGRVSVTLHLLSPAHRPVAITQDLASFWRNAYPEVRKEMRGRYPKHSWPEDPLHAKPTKR